VTKLEIWGARTQAPYAFAGTRMYRSTCTMGIRERPG
jgi:hypothetical protein